MELEGCCTPSTEKADSRRPLTSDGELRPATRFDSAYGRSKAARFEKIYSARVPVYEGVGPDPTSFEDKVGSRFVNRWHFGMNMDDAREWHGCKSREIHVQMSCTDHLQGSCGD
jgi:hypothetical protein